MMMMMGMMLKLSAEDDDDIYPFSSGLPLRLQWPDRLLLEATRLAAGFYFKFFSRFSFNIEIDINVDVWMLTMIKM